MKRFFALFTDPRVLTLLGVIALSLAVWFGGAYIRLGDSPEPLSAVTRLGIIMVLLVLWGLNNLRMQVSQNKKNKEMLGELEASAQSEPEPSASAADKEESKLIHSRFQEAVEALKTQRFGKDKKRRTLYELPWYVIIGPPGAGKTTVLANSGLQFPLKEKFGLQGLGGVGGTRNCDWWFTDDAILIDTAGRYTTQDSHADSDKTAWRSFLDLLKKYRPRRAINGALVAVSLHELMLMSAEERQQHAETIRNRIQELMSDLGIKFPIYFLLTKADLMSGFTEYFEYLDQSEREQVWGATFDLESGSDVKGVFEREFDLLVKRINERLLWRLHQERDPQRRAKIQGFPSQVENMRGILVDFVNSTFGDNQYQDSPLLRGVYMTSGTQEGSPIDRILSSLSASYGVQPQGMAPPPGQGKSFFIHRLLKQVIFAEADMVGVNVRYEKRLKWGRRIAMFATALVILGAGAAWTTSLNQNEALMADVAKLLEEHQQAVNNIASHGNRFEASIAVLEPLQKATQVYDQIELPFISNLGLYDESVDEAAHKAYDAALAAHFNPVVTKRLESFLLGSQDNDALYDALRVYLMLGDASRFERNEVLEWFKEDWQKSFESQSTKQSQLLTYLERSLTLGFTEFHYNDNVVQRTRNVLRKIPIEKRIYKQIERDPELRLQSDLVQAIGSDVLDVFKVNAKSQELPVAFMFTKAGYEKMDFSKESPLIRKYATEQWILGSSQTEDFSDKDIEQIGQKVKTIYLENYTDTWRTLIEKFAVKDFTSSGMARSQLDKLSDNSQSALVKILSLVTNETALTPEVNLLQGKDSGVAGAVAKVATKALPPTMVDKAFKPIRQLIRQERIKEVIESVSQLQEKLEEFSFAPIPNEASMKFAAKRFAGSGNDPMRKLLALASKQPKPVRRWLEKIVDQSWKVVLIDSKQHLNTVWQTAVYQNFDTSFKGRYPFNKGGDQVVPLIDFTEFFKPEGTEQSYVSQYLAPFIKTGKSWKQRSLNGRSLEISKNTLKQLKKAEDIRAVFFRKGGDTPAFSYKLKPNKMDSTVRRFELSLGKTTIRYSHGPKLSKSLNWPADTAEGVSVLFEDINETRHKNTFNGDWSFFQLLDASKVKSTKRSNVYDLTFNVGHRKAEYQLSALSELNPFAPGWIAEYQCPKLL